MQLHKPLNSGKLVLLLGISAGLACLVMTRLYFIQIIHAPFFAKLARAQYTVTVDLPATRGTIFDRYGTPLALPYQRLSAFVSREHIEHPEVTLAFLHDHYPTVHTGLTKQLDQSFFWVTRGLDANDRQALHAQCSDIKFLYEPTRWYAQPYAPHVTGFTGPDTHGISGTERFAQAHLAGSPQRLRCEPSSTGDGLYHLQRYEYAGSAGRNVLLSLDSTLQFSVQRALAHTVKQTNATCGSALIINPDTGEVLTMAQAPSFDPNKPTKAKPSQRTTHSIASLHEFGGTMMIFAALAALAEDEATVHELITCEGTSAIVDTVQIKNDKELHTIPLWQVVSQCGNVGIAKVSQRLGTRLYTHLQRLGFGSTVGIELPNEQAGFITPPTRWSAASSLQLSNGYEVMSTLAQVARALAIIANGGHAISLTTYPQSNSQRGQPLYNTAAIDSLRLILEKSAAEHEATIPGCTVLGHVGSARMLHDGEYSDTHELYTFCGIVERGNYRRVVVANVEGARGKNVRKALWQLGVTLGEHAVLKEKVNK